MELDVRGTEAATLKGYLELLGGVPTEEDTLVGDGWEARLTVGIHRFYKWDLPRVVVTFAGDPGKVAEVARRFQLMAFRGGG